MRRLAVALVLLAAGACTSRPEDDPDRLFAAAQEALRRGAVDKALAHTDRGSTVAPADDDSPRAHRFRLLRADILLAKPDVAGAMKLLDAQLPDRPDVAPLRTYEGYLRARVQAARGQLKEALSTLDSLPTAPDGADARLDAEIFAGQLLLRLGRPHQGEARIEAVVGEAAARGDRYHQVLAWNTLGMGLVVRSRFDEALAWFERVLAASDLGETSVYAMALTNAGACYARLGDFDRAIATQRRAVDLHERRGFAGPYEQALGELGSTHLLREDVPQAVTHLTRALEVASSAGLTNDAAIWAKNLAAAYVEIERWDEAERFNDEARRLTPVESVHKLTFNTLHAANIAAGRGRDADAGRLFDQIVGDPAADPSVRWAAHEGLALLAQRSGDNRRAAAHLGAALAIIEKTRSDLLKADYRLSFVTRLIRFYQRYVEVLLAQGQVEEALAVADSSRGRVLAERHGIPPPVSSRRGRFRTLAAQSNATLVSYWLAHARSYVWIVEAGGVRVHELPPAEEIERLVGEHQASIHNALSDPASPGSAGDRLYRLLVAPVLSALPRERAVIIVADGALHALNFETLPVDGPRRHYWIEDVTIQVAPSLTLLAARRPPAPARSLLLMGNPTPRQPEFPALRYASAEMASVARHFSADRTRSYQGDRATPDAYRAAGPEQFALVHFTAHAAANRESPLDSAVILSGPDQAFKLYARDVAELPLRAELVTVSACRGAGERAYSGEGLVGFAWAFLRAGARRVVAGLWDVDDRSTADLMDRLYERLAAGETPARALRDAKLALLTRGGTTAKPYYWGPFQLFTVEP